MSLSPFVSTFNEIHTRCPFSHSSIILLTLPHSPPLLFFPVLRNKLAHTLVLLFSHCYLTTWSSFFDDLLSLQSSPGASSDPRIMLRIHDLLLRIWMSIDEECVSSLVPRSKEALDRNTLIKDQMREGDIAKMVSHWYSILESYPGKDSTLVNMALRVISVYIVWIDVSFIVNDTVMGTLFQLFQQADYCVSASDCLAEVSPP